ncbi:MAG: amidase [Alphaproteobacteria bacterium]
MNEAVARVANRLETVAAREAAIQAWAWIDSAHAMAQARAGTPGPLDGLPVGIKDIIDTADMPTENGSPLCVGRRPTADATLVQRLRAAGAVMLGKTVTTEFALAGELRTKNPHDPARTPGASSAGSAAAVAAGMVPAAIGTQTVGSLLRPAAYCGVVGFKPTHGLIPLTGVARLSERDQAGVLATSIEQASAVAAVMAGQAYSEIADTRPPRLGFVRTAAWPEAQAETRLRVCRLAQDVEAREIVLPAEFDDALDVLTTIVYADVAEFLAPLQAEHGDRMSPLLRRSIEQGRTIAPTVRAAARRRQHELAERLDEILADFDGVLTPATPGEAPLATEGTGNPVFFALWTLCGVPALSLPLLRGPSSLPLGVQLVGAGHSDQRLLRAAHWLIAHGRSA